MQVVHAKAALPIEEQDWRGVPADEQAGRWAAYLEADRQAGFDFARAPLMRLALMRCAEDRWLFLWSHHHVLLDGWSGPLVLKDAFTAYLSLIHGELDPIRAAQTIPRLPRLAVGSGHGGGGSLLAAIAGGLPGADPFAVFVIVWRAICRALAIAMLRPALRSLRKRHGSSRISRAVIR